MTNEFNHEYIEPLTNRELDVLKLLAKSSSNQEIASALSVEVSTVKWYNSQIYAKLQVKNRKQAVIRAQTLGILKSDSADPLLRILHNLPVDPLPFIGREREIKEIIAHLNDDTIRLITILGAGGMGKSRLSIEVGRRLLPKFLQGVYFISLAPITSTEQIITTIADTIGFRFHSDVQAKQQLLDYLANQNMLLIIDNFEHLLESADLLTDILKIAPQINILVTSRETLNLTGEVLYHIRGLSVSSDDSKKQITDNDGVKLFVEASKRRNVKIADSNIEIVSDICQLVGGMPLAILLAAAWMDTLTLPDMLDEIKEGLDILEANLRDSPERHQSIETVFDTSWKRLSEKEQNVFMKLSVFREGFTREAAKAVAGASVRDLQRLVHTSFIQHQPSGRYAIHELMRQYGKRKLVSSGDFHSTKDEHARFFATFITPLANMTWGMATRDDLEPIHHDYENIRVAWLYRSEQKNITELQRFLDGLWMFFDQYSRSREGIDLFEPLLAEIQHHSVEAHQFRGQLLTRLGWFYNDVGQPQKFVEFLEEALSIAKKHNMTNDMLFIYFAKYMVNVLWDNAEVWEANAEEGYALAQKTQKDKWLPLFTVAKSFKLYFSEQQEEAQRLINTLPDFKFRITMTSAWLEDENRYAELEERLLAGFKKYHLHRIEYILWYGILLRCAIHTKQFDKAWRYLYGGLQYGDDDAYAWGTFMMLTNTLELLVVQQHYERATEILGLVMSHPANIESNRQEAEQYTDILVAQLFPQQFESAWERGKALGLNNLISELMEH